MLFFDRFPSGVILKLNSKWNKCLIVEAVDKLAFRAAAEPSLTSDVLRWPHRDPTGCIELPWTPGSSVFWWRGGGRTAYLATPPPTPPESLTSAGCFCWAGFPIVHTPSWLASQGCCWLLGPLIGSSCALASLACLGRASARSSPPPDDARPFGRNFAEKTVKKNQMRNWLRELL